MNNNDAFKASLSQLNPKQREAVETIDGPVMVIAGPGTGKTQILTLRIANILEKTDTSASSILALTFTESAATNMRRRLVSLIGSTGYYVSIGTFHGFCNQLIHEYPEYYHRIIGGKNASEVDRISLVRSIIDSGSYKILKPFGDPHFYVRDILSAIKTLKNEGVSEAAFENLNREADHGFETNSEKFHKTGAHAGKLKGVYAQAEKDNQKNQELARIYQQYQQGLREKKLYDFEDMVLETISAFENHESFLREIQEKFQYFLVDEHQDTNGSQNRILELLCSYYPNPNLFIVGDEKQAIFRFQGANLDNFLYFKNKFPTAKSINLEENYRSTQNILDSAQSLIEKNQTTIFAPLKAQAENPGQIIQIFDFETKEGECLFLVNKIQDLLVSGVSPRQIAVLYRENRDASPIANLLEKDNIPFTIESDLSVLDDPDIQKLNNILEAIQRFGEEESFIKALHSDFFEIDPLDLYILINYKNSEKTTLHQVIEKNRAPVTLDPQKFSKLEEIYQLFKKWHRESHNSNFLKFFEKVMNESGFLRHLIKNGNYSNKLDKLNALFAEVKKATESNRDFGLPDYLNYLHLLKTHGLLIQAKTTVSKDSVKLMTAHRAKGLEFEAVFIIQGVDGHWGNKRKSNRFNLPIKTAIKTEEIEKNEDERRLFYMAITRAKKYVFITYSNRDENGREQVPSQFLDEIHHNLKEYVSGAKYDELFSQNKAEILTIKTKPVRDSKEIDFVREVFQKRGLSVTALNNYLACPWRYFYRNLLRIPGTENKHQIFGIAVHSALKTFFDQKKEGRDVGIEQILITFSETLQKKILAEAEYKEILEKGEKTLRKYYDTYKNSWNYNTLNEVTIYGVNLDEIRLTGKLDKIEFGDEVNTVTVVDYKTRKPESRNAILGLTKNSTGDYKRQLVFYKLLLDLKPEKTWNMRFGVIDFIEPNDRGIFKKEIFEIEPPEVESLKTLIKNVATEITNLAFWDRFCVDKNCEYCALRKLIK